MNRNKFEKWAVKNLVGKTIKSVGYLDSKEKDAMLWDRSCMVLELNNGTLLFPSSDDEGNDAGALFVQTKDRLEVLPVI